MPLCTVRSCLYPQQSFYTFLALFHLAIARGLNNNKNIEDLVSVIDGVCIIINFQFRSREVVFYGAENCEYSLQLAG